MSVIKRRDNYTLTRRNVGDREVVSINVDAANRAWLQRLQRAVAADDWVPLADDLKAYLEGR